MKGLTVFLLLALTAGIARGAPLDLRPPSIFQGGVAILIWGEDPPSSATAVFRGLNVPLRTEKGKPAGLLGCDLETEPGAYPVVVSMIDSQGRKRIQRLDLEVREKEFPEERLSLPSSMVSPTEPEVLERIASEQKLLQGIFGNMSGGGDWSSFRAPVEGPVGSEFGRRRILNGEPRSPHAGIDFRSPAGTPVLAPAEGRVVFVGDLFFTGLTVVLDHGQGLYSLYAHLERIDCHPGDTLALGQEVGRVGQTGRATGPHLHWGVKLRGDRIDPLALVEAAGEKKIDWQGNASK